MCDGVFELPYHFNGAVAFGADKCCWTQVGKWAGEFALGLLVACEEQNRVATFLMVNVVLACGGYRFTVSGPRNKKLSGKPDIVLPKWGTVVFVHGRFKKEHLMSYIIGL